ncbi:fumarylacetoacetate hydrolase family protein [Cellulomonas aerilata]|uniref:2-hydroxyhepta-2,4-diene-1,7-dioate isomerase n=1 Tax=Cellulomonas aerilata TaxID=515326 RepID=A0A512DCH9_9CELL|nr:fumarylacetoacetate hydrolase family protein [Cellulomonas aerilata]GEO34165.1 2-hydroxyhepta-2,4-diene-1,7-dioate isomerase [Cellulomonas aerilata]
MKLLRHGPAGAESPAVLHDDAAFSLTPLTADIDGAFLAGGGIARVRRALTDGSLPLVDLDGQRLGPPVARPSAVVCIGQNYAAHAAESGAQPPALPIVFLKTPNTVVGPFDDVVIPPASTRTDWEVELAVVIGARAWCLPSPADAAGCIAGYTISNDVSERTWQIDLSGGQWSKGKCAPTFNPLGPYLVPADELDPGDLRLGSTVNGEVRQASVTADMIFDVPYLIWHLSQFMALEPGDVVNTGTPEGVAFSGRFPYLSDGDVMTMHVEGLGEQTQTVRRAVRAPSGA